MFTMDNFIVAQSLEEAYTLNQRRSNVVLGGILWLKMGRKKIGTGIDLSALGLNTIEESEGSFSIGCMCTLREVELHQGLNDSFQNLFKRAIENIVGVQFRNVATVGGSVFSRFGFSDVLTAFLATDSYVELYKGGKVAMSDFVEMPRDNDILVKIVVQKDLRNTSYRSFRISSGDLPILTCAVSNSEHECGVVIGARPTKAKLLRFQPVTNATPEYLDKIIASIREGFVFGTNMRAGNEYRKHLAEVLARRNFEEIISGGKAHAY